MPGLLKSAEQKLLLNKPGVWSTRTHLVLYYGLLFMVLLAVVCFLDPSDLRTGSMSPIWIGFVSVISIIALVVWLIYLLRFNLFKRYGVIDRFYTLTSFILYFISAGIIVLFAYVQPAVESIRANMAYGDEEIVKDINAINTKVCQLEYNLLKMPWSYDTVSIVEEGEEPRVNAAYVDGDYERTDTIAGKPARHHIFLDSAAFSYKQHEVDSLIKLNDTLYILHYTPAYDFIGLAIADNSTMNKLLSSFDLYNKVFKYPQHAADRATISKELGVLLHKYHYQEDLPSHSRNLEIEENDGPFDIVSKKYHLVHVQTAFSNIIEKKYRWSKENLPPYIRVFYYVTLIITLLVFIFRHTTTRTFFLSLLTGVLLAILTGLTFAFFHSEDSTFLLTIVNYTILFFLASLLVFYIHTRKVVTGIFINLFVSLVPFFPLFIFFWYDAWKKEQIYKQYGGDVQGVITNIDKYIVYAETGGALLFIILLVTYINKVYRRWYSLPQE